MGFVDKLRGELIDIVEWVDDSRHTLVWRFPRYHNQIKNGAQLIVRPGQVALFVNEGELADVFEPGTHTLETRNLPVLSTLKGWKHGFESPFKAEVYFVSTRQVTDLKWGTPNPVPMRDPDFGPIRIRAFGTFTLRAVDPRALITQLTGTDSVFESEEISVLLRSIIAHSFSDHVAGSGMSVLDFASSYTELSDQVRDQVVQKIDDEYGLDIPQLYIVNISLPEEVEQALDARSSMGIIGDMNTYQQYQIGQSMPAAAENPAGGLAGAGIGMGMGMAVAGRMMPGMMPGGPQGAPPGAHGMHGNPGTPGMPGTAGPGAAAGSTAPGAITAPVAMGASGLASVPCWHLAAQGKTEGPYTIEQIGGMIIAGRIRVDTPLWMPGMAGWLPAEQVPPIALYFETEPPPPPPGS